MDIGKKISEIMAEINVSQAELSRLTGIHPSLVSKLLRDQRRWNTDQIQTVCRALALNPKEIFNDQYVFREEKFIGYKADNIIDLQILADAILQTELFVESQKIRISPDRKAKLILKLYEHWLIEQESPDNILARRYFQLV